MAITSSTFSELLKSMLEDNKINVPITIEIPGNASANILAEEVKIIESESLHFIINLTRINGEIYLNNNVKAAKGHNSSGEVDAKCTAQSAIIKAKLKRMINPASKISLDLLSVAL